ncbi:Gut-specific cysteine proteinase [Entamoeba marina]
MMLVLLICATALADFKLSKGNDVLYEEWKEKFNKRYSTVSEQVKRKVLFMKKLEEVREWNNGNHKYTKTINKFSDYDSVELQRLHSKSKPVLSSTKAFDNAPNKRSGKLQPKSDHTDVDLPSGDPLSSFSICQDATNLDLCGSTNLDQGNCGSCYAAGPAQFLQAQYANLTYEEYGTAEYAMPSIQQFIDCSDPWGGCGGGFAEEVLASNEFVSMASDYPYEDKSVICDSDCDSYQHTCQTGMTTPMQIVDIVSFDNLSKDDLKKTIHKYGQFITAMYASSDLTSYSSGIYGDDACMDQITNHVVLVDGYGTEDGTDFLWVRNSWGSNWGYNGHFKLNMDYLCGVNGIEYGVQVNWIPIVNLTEDGTKGTYGEVWFDLGAPHLFMALIAFLFFLF